jgi:hypothetical protein
LTGRTQGLLDRCSATDTCPRIFHVATALEMWEGRQSLGLTDPLGQRDADDPPNVRTFIMASTQHGAASCRLRRTRRSAIASGSRIPIRSSGRCGCS